MQPPLVTIVAAELCIRWMENHFKLAEADLEVGKLLQLGVVAGVMNFGDSWIKSQYGAAVRKHAVDAMQVCFQQTMSA